ncbi:MAG TPA: helix-turn-helix transcriptional regulator [Gammaproteobacteria bacterium]|nr:helix-turn-helix transcriptional regulator [Gammaproteobacteria bacterium]
MKPLRLKQVPETMRQQLKAERIRLGWSQAALGARIGLPQMHISGIESGKIVPRFDTLLDLVRVLNYDLLLVPRTLVPAVQALIRDNGKEGEELPLYAMLDGDEESEEGLPHDEV